ncbi:hypothetical protein BDW74DRAFT_159261 [Aspergillus multicolor]|uniref:mitochondrial 37S ribosomal protein bS18m n=1 Tax=Aspergillus multicolor TaxID=41759 RepID=UPI003CCCF1D4
MSFPLFNSASARALAPAVRCAYRTSSTVSNPAKSVKDSIGSIIGSAKPGSGPGRLPTRRGNRWSLIEEQRTATENRAMEQYQTREWKSGDIYSPHDLSPAEMKKWKKRNPPTSDVFDAVDLNPLDVYKNFSIMSEYMTEMGRIKHRKVTGLRGVNQRKLAKAIRRAIGVGLMPSVHRHPEILAELKVRTDGTLF